MEQTDPEKIRDCLLKTIDTLIEEGEWESSLFLRNILKRLQALRERIHTELGVHPDSKKVARIGREFFDIQNRFKEQEGHRRVYISLYQAESNRLDLWYLSIKRLVGHSVSRPIYGSREDVENMIRSRQSKNDGYVEVWVKEADILPPAEGIPAQDRWGRPLLSLREGGFLLKNVVEFVLDGKEYHLTEKGLILCLD